MNNAKFRKAFRNVERHMFDLAAEFNEYASKMSESPIDPECEVHDEQYDAWRYAADELRKRCGLFWEVRDALDE